MSGKEWLLLMTQLPAIPSSLRVNVWRRLKKYGAASLQNGSWILPLVEANEIFLKRLQLYILENNATAQLFKVQSLNQSVQTDILRRFKDDRDEEYDEVLAQCNEFQLELSDEIENKVFTFIELEDNEQKFQRLKIWIGKIHRRDFMEVEKYQEVLAAFKKCRNLLKEYTRLVYEKEGMVIDQNSEYIAEDDLLFNFEENN